MSISYMKKFGIIPIPVSSVGGKSGPTKSHNTTGTNRIGTIRKT